MGFLFGDARYRCPLEGEKALWRVLMRLGIPYKEWEKNEEGILFRVSCRDSRRLLSACRAEGLCLAEEGRRGLPILLHRYRARWGLAVGGLLASLLLFASSRIVWDVRVTGNETLDDRAVLQMLAECGLETGTYLPRLDTDLVEGRLLLSHEEICWVSVNVRGTTANVEILETARGQPQDSSAVNLVAAADGRIERIEVYDGHVCVKVGDVVRKGDLLVSGAYDDGLLGPRVTHAKGAVYARTVRTFEVEIPLEYAEKVYTGRVWREIYVKFFAKRIKVFANTGNLGGECDIIYRDNGITLPNGAELPVHVESVLYRAHRSEYRRLTGEEAVERGFSALASRLESFVSETGAELLGKEIRWELDEASYRICCRVICIENVAREQQFDAN